MDDAKSLIEECRDFIDSDLANLCLDSAEDSALCAAILARWLLERRGEWQHVTEIVVDPGRVGAYALGEALAGIPRRIRDEMLSADGRGSVYRVRIERKAPNNGR